MDEVSGVWLVARAGGCWQEGGLSVHSIEYNIVGGTANSSTFPLVSSNCAAGIMKMGVAKQSNIVVVSPKWLAG